MQSCSVAETIEVKTKNCLLEVIFCATKNVHSVLVCSEPTGRRYSALLHRLAGRVSFYIMSYPQERTFSFELNLELTDVVFLFSECPKAFGSCGIPGVVER